MLHHYLGYSFPEIGDALGIPTGTAKSRVHRATQMMRAALQADAQPATTVRGRPSMNTRPDPETLDLDTDRILADFLAEEAPPHEPPVLLPALLARTALTRRRPAWRIPSWWLPANLAWRPGTPGRSFTMFSAIRVVAAVVILAIVSGTFFVNLTNSPIASRSDVIAVTLAQSVADPAARRREPRGRDDLRDRRPLLRARAPRPHGACPRVVHHRHLVPGTRTTIDPGQSIYDITLLPEIVDNLHADPCHWRNGALEPPVGPTVDDLATALMTQPAQNASAVTDVTLGGHLGKKVEHVHPGGRRHADLRRRGLRQVVRGRWFESATSPTPTSQAQLDSAYIIDVDGTRWVLDTNHQPGTSEADLAELEQMLASIRFEPPLASPSPSS